MMVNLSNQEKEEIVKRLVVEPIPLYNEKFPMIFFWSPKGGCTSLIKWFYYQIGLLEEAMDYNSWIHYYRMEVHQNQENYVAELTSQLIHNRKATYKLVREPFKRAVSSFLATVANVAIMNQIAPNHDQGLSFRQFLYLIKDIGVNRDNINLHLAQQYTDGEEYVIQHYIKLERFETEIKKLERQYQLLESPVSSIIKSPHHMSDRMVERGSYVDTKITLQSFESLPTFESFYDRETVDLVIKLFDTDFQKFGYDMNFINV